MCPIKSIEFLPCNDFKILRTIKIKAVYKKTVFLIFLTYLRKYERNKRNYLIFDDLDKKILSSINKIYPDTEYFQNEDILIKGKLEESLNIIPSHLKINIKFVVKPNLDSIKCHDDEGKLFQNKYITFIARVYNCKNTDFIINLFDFELIGSKEEINKLLETFETV